MDARVATLERELQALRDQQIGAGGGARTPQVTVRLPPKRKLKRFEGKTDERVDDWITEARSVLDSVTESDRVNYLIGHLEGVARDEVKYASNAEKENFEAIFTLLTKQFGERLTNAQLKRLLYDRVQGERETVWEFSRVLLGIADRVSEEADAKLQLLCEVFCENTSDKFVRRELKHYYCEHPDVSFSFLRQEGIRLADDEQRPRKAEKTLVRGVETEEATVSATSRDDVKELSAMMKELVKTQQQMVNWMAQQTTQLAKAVAVQPEGSSEYRLESRKRWLEKVECYGCKKRGHLKRNCPEKKKVSDTQARQVTSQEEARDSGPVQQGNGPDPLF
jgi:hypothetical protein